MVRVKVISFDLGSDPGRTDTANAQRFVDSYEREILYVPPWGKWANAGQRLSQPRL